MAEEHGFQAPEGPRLCANNCGFFGSPATQNFCSKCYRDLCLKEQKQKAHSTTHDPLFVLPASSSSILPSVQRADHSVIEAALPGAGRSTVSEAAVQAAAVAQPPNRCCVCKKKVGLTGFKCRCGITFCGTHRYPEQHGCTFDFKAMGRDAIAKANPLVKADKLNKI